jgi:hypothetical protein
VTAFLFVVTRIFDELANVVAEPRDELWQRLALRWLPVDMSTGWKPLSCSRSTCPYIGFWTAYVWWRLGI